TDLLNVTAMNDPAAAVVLGMDPSNVDTVIIAGRATKRNGRLRHIDWRAEREAAACARDHVTERSGDKRPQNQQGEVPQAEGGGPNRCGVLRREPAPAERRGAGGSGKGRTRAGSYRESHRRRSAAEPGVGGRAEPVRGPTA